MKRKFTIMCILALTAIYARGTIVDGVRQKPEPETMDFVTSQEVYLYNVVTTSDSITHTNMLLVTEIDYSKYDNYPYFRIETTDGTSYDVVDGKLKFENTNGSLDISNLQAFVISGFNVKRGYDYLVRVKYKSTAAGKINVQFGNWDLNMEKQDVDIDAAETFTTLDVPFSMVTCSTEDNNAWVIWQVGSIVGTVEISKVEVYQILNDDPLFDEKIDLMFAVDEAEKKTSFGKTEASFAALATAISNAKTVLQTADSEGAINSALDSLNNAVSNLKLLPGYKYLTTSMFGGSNCNYILCESTNNVYGNGNIEVGEYADLSDYDRLYIPVTEGTPRVLMNRTETDGLFNANKEESKMLEMPNDGTWAEAYYTKSDDGKMFTVNIAKIVEEFGFVHLNAIMDMNCGKVTVTDLILYTDQSVAEDEWNQLMAIHQSMPNTGAWNKEWNFADESHDISNLPGVKMKHRHVVSIDLSGNNLSGNFPFAVLALPCLETLDVSSNNLSGDIGVGMTAYIKKNPTATPAVKTLNISHNQLKGNLGLFAQPLINLTSLDVSYNQLEEVFPLVSTNVTQLNIEHQTISRTVNISLSDISATTLITKIPSIVIYDHAKHSIVSSIDMELRTIDNTWGMTIRVVNGKLSTPSLITTNNAYYGTSGDPLNVTIGSNVSSRGSNFKINLSFDPGDANFDGTINVLDLQTMLNYMFEEYDNKPFNFTASNLWKDEIINVQDAVSLVNMLLETEVAPTRIANMARNDTENNNESDASVFFENGQLIIYSTVPVSAFDIVVTTTKKCEVLEALVNAGFSCSIKQNGRQLHLVGYSLNGSILPVGKNAICNLDSGDVTFSMLSDKEAQEITTIINGHTTRIPSSMSEVQSVKEIYRIPIGAKQSISIDTTGKKTIIKEDK